MKKKKGEGEEERRGRQEDGEGGSVEKNVYVRQKGHVHK